MNCRKGRMEEENRGSFDGEGKVVVGEQGCSGDEVGKRIGGGGRRKGGG